MLKFVLGIGLVLTSASVAVGVDYNKQSAGQIGKTLALEEYAAQLPVRLTAMAKVGTKRAAGMMPQVTETWAGKDWSDMTNDEQIANFTNSSPQIARVVEATNKSARQGFWASVRQKFSADDKKAGNRLADIKARTAARNYKPTIQASDLSGMSAADVYKNRGEISRSFSATAAQNLNAAASGF